MLRPSWMILALLLGAPAEGKKPKSPEAAVRAKFNSYFTDNPEADTPPTGQFGNALGLWMDYEDSSEEGLGTIVSSARKRKNTVVAMSADGTAAWVTADLTYVADEEECGDVSCIMVDKWFAGILHATVLFEKVGDRWELVTFDIAPTVKGKGGDGAGGIKRHVPKAAADVVAHFETTIGDPQTLIDSVSPRSDIVLYGSGVKGRAVGAEKVKAMLKQWNLGFTVLDGVRAGVTSSGTVAWVAAGLASRRPGKAAVRNKYDAMFLYEKSGSTWQLVHANFALPLE